MILEDLAIFSISLIGVHLYPGQDRLFVIQLSLSGYKAGIYSILGIVLGSLITTTICYTLLLSTTSQEWFVLTVRVVGSGVLVVLIFNLLSKLLSEINTSTFMDNSNESKSYLIDKALLNGALIHIANPMAYIFPLTYFTSFTGAGNLSEFLILSFIGIFIATLLHLIFCVVSRNAALSLNQSFKRILNFATIVGYLVIVTTSIKSLVE